MACGCSKKKNSVTADALRAERVAYRPTPLAEGVAPTHAMEGSRYRRMMYLVAPKDQIESGELDTAERLPTLAEAQKRVRDLGSSYGIKATRT